MHQSTQRPSLAISLCFILWSVAGQIILGVAIGLFPGGMDLIIKQYNWFALIIELLLIGLPAVLYYQRHPAMEGALRLNRLPGLSALALIAAGAIGMLLLNILGSLWLALLEGLGYTPSANSGIVLPTNGAGLIMSLISIAFAPAVCEELLFRGMVLPAAEQPSGSRRAIWLSGVLFALTHGTLEGLPIHLLLGVLLGILAVYTGSLYAPMLYHLAHNAATLLFSYWMERNVPIPDDAVSAAVTWADVASLLPTLLILAGIWAVLLRFGMNRSYGEGKAALLPRTGRRPLRIHIAIGLLVLILSGVYLLNAMAA